MLGVIRLAVWSALEATAEKKEQKPQNSAQAAAEYGVQFPVAKAVGMAGNFSVSDVLRANGGEVPPRM